jgi:putative acetyltransferase
MSRACVEFEGCYSTGRPRTAALRQKSVRDAGQETSVRREHKDGRFFFLLDLSSNMLYGTVHMSITIEQVSPDSTAAVALIRELDEHLDQQPYTASSRHAFSVDKLICEGVAFFVLNYLDQPAACGGVKLIANNYGEVKRMFVRPTYRGLGLGMNILDRLAEHTRANGISVLRLETGIYQKEAIGLYEKYGFERRPPFGEYREDPMSIYFEKVLF